MDLLTFISDPGRKARLAALTQSSEGYLWQIATAWTPKGGKPKRASPELARAIASASAVIGPEPVPKESLRPDLWPPVEGGHNRTHAASEGPSSRRPEAVTSGQTAEAAETPALRVA